jgi:DNA processing protein
MAHFDALYAHFFNLVPELGPARLYKIGQYFQNFEKAFFASAQELAFSGMEEKHIEKFLEIKKLTSPEQEIKNLEKEKIEIITYQDVSYPKLLLETERFPAILYYKGQLPQTYEICLAVVGTRKISNYGRTIMPGLLEPLINSGIIIVSGLAYGVDGSAHELTVNLKRKTIAILGGGLDAKSLYPQNHSFLAQRIIENNGCLISEYPPLTPNLKHHFVSRNRIISGLSLGTLIVECNLNSGSLITAEHALEQNRTVYAVPGPIYSENSQGPNNLIRMGARIVTKAEDILEDLNLPTAVSVQETQSLFGNTPAENLLLKNLTHEPKTLNQLIKDSALDSAQAISALTFLEMKGKIRNLGGQQYILSR